MTNSHLHSAFSQMTHPFHFPLRSFRDTHSPYDRPFIDQAMTQGVLVYRIPSGIRFTDTALVRGGRGGLITYVGWVHIYR